MDNRELILNLLLLVIAVAWTRMWYLIGKAKGYWEGIAATREDGRAT